MTAIYGEKSSKPLCNSTRLLEPTDINYLMKRWFHILKLSLYKVSLFAIFQIKSETQMNTDTSDNFRVASVVFIDPEFTCSVLKTNSAAFC